MDKLEIEVDVDAKRVEIEIPADWSFKHLMMACEYLMTTTAQRSHAGFEKALDLLCEGATEYHTIPGD